MPDRSECGKRLAADPPGGRIRARQLRMLGLEPLQLLEQPVIFGIRQDRLVKDVIGVVCLLDAGAQFADSPLRIIPHAASSREQA